MESVNLFGKDIKLRTHNFALFVEKGTLVEEPNLNLVVRTKHCNAKCAFCIYRDDASKWNGEKYREVLQHNNGILFRLFIY